MDPDALHSSSPVMMTGVKYHSQDEKSEYLYRTVELKPSAPVSQSAEGRSSAQRDSVWKRTSLLFISLWIITLISLITTLGLYYMQSFAVQREVQEQQRNSSTHNTELQKQLEEKEQENSQLQNQLEDKEKENSQLQSQLEDKEKENSQLQSQLEDKEKEDSQLQKQLVEKEQEKSQLQKQLGEKEQENSQLQKQLKDKEKENSQLQKQLGEKEQENSLLQKQLGEKEQENSQLQKQLKDKEKENSQLQKQLGEKEQENSQLQNQLEDKEKENSQLQSQLEDKEKENSQLQKQLGEKEQENSQLQEQLKDKEKENSQLQSQLEDKEKENSQLQKQLGEKEQENSQLQEQLKDKEKENSQLQSQLEDKEKENSQLQKQLVEKEQENSQLQNQLEDKEKENSQLQKRLKDKEKENSNLQKQLWEKEQKFSDLHTRFSSMRASYLPTEMCSSFSPEKTVKGLFAEWSRRDGVVTKPVWGWIREATVDVTLDPDTAHPNLILSEDGKRVRDGDTQQNVPDTPKRFDPVTCVLGKEGFSSGRFYYEVQVGEKIEWDLGLAKESINRKGDIILSPEDGYWTVWLRNGTQFEALADPSVLLPLREKPRTVGVYVDYEGGQVSFYNVETRSHIYSFTGYTFTEKLYPFFSPCLNMNGKNSAPLIISSVR